MQVLGVKQRTARAMTLIEVTIAMVVAAVAVLAASGYRYYATIDTNNAAACRTAARIALLVGEGWRGDDGDQSYDPVTLFGQTLAIAGYAAEPAIPADFTDSLGTYQITMNNAVYYVTCYWRDQADQGLDGLRALNVNVAWNCRYGAEAALSDADRSFALTTYAITQ